MLKKTFGKPDQADNFEQVRFIIFSDLRSDFITDHERYPIQSELDKLWSEACRQAKLYFDGLKDPVRYTDNFI